MRIGEIAVLVGLSTRAIRHYHHVGLLPEPERRPNGYRAYSVRDAVLLARVRRLTELGLSLDEVRDAIRRPSLTFSSPVSTFSCRSSDKPSSARRCDTHAPDLPSRLATFSWLPCLLSSS
jgi:DNA-binding transcriptional MerR regulator